ncbi:LPD28 domain-containing protein, partial [Ruminococcus sp.]|uniref:LPD28 domain-containing protein n=1 Tax=Ruminococcus sp. TaxID=41978 RepID=UPI00388E5465
ESIDFPLDNVRLDTTSIEELNFLAKRLNSLDRQEHIVFDALTEKYFSNIGREDIASVKDLINLTYGLDTIPMVQDINDLEELGRFAVVNDFITDLKDVPNSALKYLDYEVIGQEQMEKDDGFFIDGCYVAVGEYGYPEVYDGVNIPQTEDFENAVFRLLVSKAPVEDPSEVMDSAHWLELPIGIDELHEFAAKLGADSIEDCVYYDFQSGIPQIDEDVFDSMEKIGSLNIIANEYLMQSYDNRILYKAIIEAENIGSLEEMKDVFEALNRYELCYQDENADEFFKRFLAYHAPTDFDTKWLEQVSSHDDAQKLLKTLGAKVTNYGIVSAFGRLLYENVAFPTQESETERYELIEVCGQKALFSNGRIPDTEVPDGMYRYDFREDVTGDDIYFAGIEPDVYVNHAGSCITKEPIDFGSDGYIQFNYDTEPNFLGEEMTVEEFADADFSEDESADDEPIQSGGMKL